MKNSFCAPITDDIYYKCYQNYIVTGVDVVIMMLFVSQSKCLNSGAF